MKSPAFIRDRVIAILEKEEGFNGMVAAEINGCVCSAADIALPDENGDSEVFRIAVVPHSWRKHIVE